MFFFFLLVFFIPIIIDVVIVFVVVIYFAIVVLVVLYILVAFCGFKLALIIVMLLKIHLDGFAAEINDLVKGIGKNLLWEATCSKKKRCQGNKAA